MKGEIFSLFFVSGLLLLFGLQPAWAAPDSDYNRPNPLLDYVNQELGMYDTGYWELPNAECMNCHGDYHGGGGACTTLGVCHSWDEGLGRGWHHNSEESGARNCQACHSTLVIGPYTAPILFDDDPPTANPPTPFSCENCHWQQPVTAGGHPSTYDHGDPAEYYEYGVTILDNGQLHHMGTKGGNVGTQCSMCHKLNIWYPEPDDPEAIRYCESCHTKETLHAIHQQDQNGWEAVGFHVPGKPEADPNNYRLFVSDDTCVGCHAPIQPVVGAIVLKDLDHHVVTNEFRPGTNIRYKITFGLDGVPGMLYKVVVNGKVVSLYEPDGFNSEWKEKFNEAKKKKLYEGEEKQAIWDSQIPVDATPGTKAKVVFIMKLKAYNEASQTWNLMSTLTVKAKLKIIP